ncbi:Protein of unknown function [Gryllus bimaculatus]|nr:Protein of unknown function [Gryllus bimaculatus]
MHLLSELSWKTDQENTFYLVFSTSYNGDSNYTCDSAKAKIRIAHHWYIYVEREYTEFNGRKLFVFKALN